MRNPWLSLSFDMMRLGLESQAVMTLRTVKILRGGAAGERESVDMVTEKALAAFEAQMTIANGAFRGLSQAAVAGRVVKGYGRRVTANRKRLTP